MVSGGRRVLAEDVDMRSRVEVPARPVPSRTAHSAGVHVGDEGVPYVACLSALCVVVQGAAGGRDPRTVLVCAGVHFASAFLVQDGPPSTRVGSAVVFTVLLTILGVGFGLALT